jgi:phosphoribosylformylglycinamidine (FGAM) synthase-like enzyme
MYGFTYTESQGVALVLQVLGDMPRKRFEFIRKREAGEPLDIAPGVTPLEALKRVLHLPSVCSKRFLTTKVDRCVTGLVAQQQTVGPLQLPLADVAVLAQVYLNPFYWCSLIVSVNAASLFYALSG